MIPAHGKYPGYFITFEGIDGSGKTVQIGKLIQFLKEKGRSIISVRDPGGPAISEEIRHILLNIQNAGMSPETELLLYEAARGQLVYETIIPALKAGKIVLSDRFFDSTTAYQGYGRSLPLEIIEKANGIGSVNISPDRTYLLDIDWETSRHRQQKAGKVSDRMESNAHTFFDRVRSGYLEIAVQNKSRILKLDGTNSVSVLEHQIQDDVINILSL